MQHYMRVCAEINLDAVAYNFYNMKENLHPDTRMIAVVKTDGYGHGAVPIARMVQEYSYIWGFAVATVEEAVLLRTSGITKPILILGFVFPDAYEEVVRYELRVAVFQLNIARLLAAEAVHQGKKVFIHIKVDTGMSRIGFADTLKSADEVRAIADLPQVEIEGVFTHFARADEKDKTAAKEQLSRFLQFAELLEERQVKPELLHCSNSAGIVDFKEANLNLVRAGISIYGMYPSDEVNKLAVPLAPVMALKSHVVYVKEIQKGTAVSYGGTYVADSTRRIATIPVGYGDGYPRSLSNKGWVLIRGQRAPITGRVCMDQFMVDVTGIHGVKEGDMVTLVGADGGDEITMEELGEISGRFHYELACDIGKRVPRRFWKDGRIVGTQDYFEGSCVKMCEEI